MFIAEESHEPIIRCEVFAEEFQERRRLICMNYIINEIDVKNTVDDFIEFCNFIEREKPLATAKGDLSTKACYEINKVLRYSQNDAKTTDRMHRYASASLWFAVAKEAGFIVCEPIKGGKNVCVATEKYTTFKAINVFSQYIVIFHIWFCFVDAEVQYNERGFTAIVSRLLDEIFAQLVQNGSETWIEYSEEEESQVFGADKNPIQVVMERYYRTACNLRDLGFVIFEDSEKREKYFNWPIIGKLKPTGFGVLMSQVCAQRSYARFNVYADEVYFNMIWGDNIPSSENVEEETPPFIPPFLDCFPQGSIDMQSVNDLIFENSDANNDDRVFEFTVSLSKKCYRVIRCLPRHTFEDLHLAIQEAFEFANDHLYSFFLDGIPFSLYAVNSPYSEEPPYTDKVCLGDKRLINKQRILYLFDYGDSWEFDVVLDVKHDSTIVLKKPEIIKSVGEAPEQYSDFDENDEMF